MKQEKRLTTALKNKRLDWQLQKRKLQYHFLNNFGKVECTLLVASVLM